MSVKWEWTPDSGQLPPRSTFSKLILVAWNQPWWKFLYHGNGLKNHFISLFLSQDLSGKHLPPRHWSQAPVIFKDPQFSSVAQSCPTLCDPMNRSTPGLPVHRQLPEFTQTHFHQVGDAIQPSHPLSSPSPLAPNPSQHQSLFQWVNSSHEVAKVLEFQL